MTRIKLPGLIDNHVHLREPGGTHKEDWLTGTQAALAGGFTAVLAMPNTLPPIVDGASLDLTLEAAADKCVCDYGIYLGATVENANNAADHVGRVAGMKMYLDDTFGTLKIDWRDLTTMNAHFANWPANSPLVCHAEERTIPAAIMLAQIHNRPVHILHVSRKSEIDCIEAAKNLGLPVTCEVGPHHLYLSVEDFETLGYGFKEVRPRLAELSDQAALWSAIERGVVDCIATDHAPHLPAEKTAEKPSPGFAGLEVSLALMLRAVHEGRITIERLTELMYHNPRKIFGLPEQPETWIEVDMEKRWTVRAADMYSRCGWSPFEGWELQGKVEKVVLRGEVVVEGGVVSAEPGTGQRIQRVEG